MSIGENCLKKKTVEYIDPPSQLKWGSEQLSIDSQHSCVVVLSQMAYEPLTYKKLNIMALKPSKYFEMPR